MAMGDQAFVIRMTEADVVARALRAAAAFAQGNEEAEQIVRFLEGGAVRIRPAPVGHASLGGLLARACVRQLVASGREPVRELTLFIARDVPADGWLALAVLVQGRAAMNVARIPWMDTEGWRAPPVAVAQLQAMHFGLSLLCEHMQAGAVFAAIKRAVPGRASAAVRNVLYQEATRHPARFPKPKAALIAASVEKFLGLVAAALAQAPVEVIREADRFVA